jgi:hypothetical protein
VCQSNLSTQLGSTWSNVSTQPSQILPSINHNKVQLAEQRLPGDDDGNGGQAISQLTSNKPKI